MKLLIAVMMVAELSAPSIAAGENEDVADCRAHNCLESLSEKEFSALNNAAMLLIYGGECEKLSSKEVADINFLDAMMPRGALSTLIEEDIVGSFLRTKNKKLWCATVKKNWVDTK